MGPKIDVSAKLLARLEERARGFDTPENVIERLLEAAHGVADGIPNRGKTPSSIKRDYSKYKFNGQEYGKGRLVLAVVQAFVDGRESTSYQDLLAAFPPKLQGSLGVFTELEEARSIAERGSVKRHFIKSTEQINLSDSTVAVCTQWGKENISAFLVAAGGLGFQITELRQSPSQIESRRTMTKARTLRRLVEDKWRAAGRPAWNYKETRDACVAADQELAEMGLNPARRFREEVSLGNEKYEKQWVKGCHFDWLNPR